MEPPQNLCVTCGNLAHACTCPSSESIRTSMYVASACFLLIMFVLVILFG